MDEQLFNRVCDLIVDETGARRSALTPEVRLLHDLGVFGDDAGALLTRFSNEFGVDLSTFRFQRYFYDEPHLLNLSALWWGTVAHRHSRKRRITVAMLVRAAELHCWEDDEPNSSAPAA